VARGAGRSGGGGAEWWGWDRAPDGHGRATAEGGGGGGLRTVTRPTEPVDRFMERKKRKIIIESFFCGRDNECATKR